MEREQVTYGAAPQLTDPITDAAPASPTDARRGAQLLADALVAEGVEIVFGYPGGANLEIFDAVAQSGLRCIRVEHEQSAAHAATGYARATGKVGVCLATSGPGATNLVTGIADANSDSVPIVAITGNVPSHLLGRNAFQEVNIVAICSPITKKTYLVSKAFEIPGIVRDAVAHALSNRPGPVLIDIPKDVQQQPVRDEQGRDAMAAISDDDAPEGMPPPLTLAQLETCRRLVREARRPVLYAGGGIASSGTGDLLLALAEKLNCPVTTTLMGLGEFPPGHHLALHALGMHGTRYANIAINEADLVIGLGVRFDDRVTGKVSEFIKHGHIIHIDVDRRELNKNKPVTLAAWSDLRIALRQLLDVLEPGDYSGWLAYLSDQKRAYPLTYEDTDDLKPQYAIELLSDVTRGDAIVALGVGQHQMWAMQYYQVRRPRSFLSSSGFGTMGFGLPAAIGAKVAHPDRTVIDIDGDGSFNMSVHELSTCHRYGLGVKVVVVNNQWLGMVRQWQDMIYDGRRSGSCLADPVTSVSRDDEAGVYPDFVTIARGYRVRAERVTQKTELRAAYERMLADPNEPYVVDVVVTRDENVFPMIPAGGSYRDILMCDDDVKRANRR